MARSDERLERLEQELRNQGSDRARLELVRRARIFKRSWVEMASALTQVRRTQAYRQWGYDDFHRYCQLELLLTASTVDKLTGSYATVREHAPHVLERDGIDQPVPSMDAVRYFAKAIEHEVPEPADSESIEQLRHAVFDENKPMAVLRKTFNPVFFPKTEGETKVETLEKVRGTVRRLEGLLERARTEEVGLDELKVERLLKALASLRDDLVEVLPDAKAALERRAS